MEQAKPWSISLGVRGFYDDNYTAAPDGLASDSYGISVNPTAALNFVLDRTLISLSYSYDMRWYEDRSENEADHMQNLNLKLSHAFTETMTVDVTERFTYSEEGVVPNEAFSGPVSIRTDATYARNTARAGFKAFFGERIGTEIAYKNELWDFSQDGPNSRSALLDRMDHLITGEILIRASKAAVGLVGYQLGLSDHTNSDGVNVPVGSVDFGFGPVTVYQLIDGAYRDYASHYIYGGLDYTFNPQLNASIRVGAQFTDYVNSELVDSYSGVGFEDSTVTPYVNASLTWTYNPGSYLQVGVIDTISQTDIASQSEQAIAVFANLNHRITPPWSVGLTALFQHATMLGGQDLDGESELMYIAGVNTSYQFSPYLSAEIGYNFDMLDSDLDSLYARDYDRNRIYIGLRATF